MPTTHIQSIKCVSVSATLNCVGLLSFHNALIKEHFKYYSTLQVSANTAMWMLVLIIFLDSFLLCLFFGGVGGGVRDLAVFVAVFGTNKGWSKIDQVHAQCERRASDALPQHLEYKGCLKEGFFIP